MANEARKYFEDIARAAELIRQFVGDKTYSDYLNDEMLRSAVERQFAIIGEALTQLARRHPAKAEKIREFRRIISFRNILIHDYGNVDNMLVWDIFESRLPSLADDVAALLAQP